MVVQAKWARCTNTAMEEQTSEGSETEKAPQSANCPLLAQHQTGDSSRMGKQETVHSWRHFLELPGYIMVKSSMQRDRGCVEVNISIPAAEVLTTPVRLKRYNWP